ncbi:MAG TPA: adenylate/guanylate cyclase domain-containing protein, partial [bacterium]|nr:adenylate/guanylate cyclase domain-containing protein [bacterium]
KFILVLTLLIFVVMGVVTWLVLSQMKETLAQQVVNRGESQARSLALNSGDMVLQLSQPVSQTSDPSLTLMQFVNDAVKMESNQSDQNIPSDLSPWEQQILAFINTYNEDVQKYLWPDAENTKRGNTEYAFVIDKNNKYVAYADLKGDIQKYIEHDTYLPPAGVHAMDDSDSTLVQTFDDHGRLIYDIAAPIDVTAEGKAIKIGEVHLGMNQNIITRVVRYVAVAIILSTLGVLLLGVLVMMVFVTVLIKPIRLLVNGVSAIAAGNLDQKINIRRSDELGDLTDAFNEMAKSLREKEVIKGAFSKYVTKSVVDRILEHKDGLKLGGEKKVVTVFFSDIRGFTPMSEVLNAEEVVHLLNEYFTAMTAIIFKYEGTLDKYMGDAIMAIYGAPIDMIDHAERAVLAAVEMGEKMKELQAKWKMEGKREVNIGIGINTGEVVVGNIGSNERMEYTAIGDNVNLTQRLESVAEKGQILISSATYERVKHKVEATMLDPIKVKGKAEKVVAYSVTGLKV